jgi:hypothetical protein
LAVVKVASGGRAAARRGCSQLRARVGGRKRSGQRQPQRAVAGAGARRGGCAAGGAGLLAVRAQARRRLRAARASLLRNAQPRGGARAAGGARHACRVCLHVLLEGSASAGCSFFLCAHFGAAGRPSRSREGPRLDDVGRRRHTSAASLGAAVYRPSAWRA